MRGCAEHVDDVCGREAALETLAHDLRVLSGDRLKATTR